MLDELIESSMEELSEKELEIFESLVLEGYEDDMEALAQDLECTIEEAQEFYEEIKKAVTSTGDISRVRSRAYRSRRAVSSTGMSKASLKLRARKAAKTRKRNPTATKKAVKKRKKALKRRRSMGL